MKYFCNIHPHLFAGCGNNWTGGLRVRSISPISDIVSIQFCCDKWRLSEATGNDLSVTDFVGDSSPERGAKRNTERQPWLPFQGSCQPLG